MTQLISFIENFDCSALFQSLIYWSFLLLFITHLLLKSARSARANRTQSLNFFKDILAADLTWARFLSLEEFFSRKSEDILRKPFIFKYPKFFFLIPTESFGSFQLIILLTFWTQIILVKPLETPYPRQD